MIATAAAPAPPALPGAVVGAAAAADDDYERDTNENEGMTDRLSLLLPNGAFPPCADKFSLTLSEAAFAGWVKQTSPACCAASTAGAWNTVLNIARDDPRALSQDGVLDVMREMQRRRIALQHAKVERLLSFGMGSIAPLLPAIEAQLTVEYPTRLIYGSKKKGTQIESKHMWYALGVVMRREYDAHVEAVAAADGAVAVATAQPGEGLSASAAASLRATVIGTVTAPRGVLHTTMLAMQQLMATEENAENARTGAGTDADADAGAGAGAGADADADADAEGAAGDGDGGNRDITVAAQEDEDESSHSAEAEPPPVPPVVAKVSSSMLSYAYLPILTHLVCPAGGCEAARGSAPDV